jgi:preprotein translocase subunit SecA
VITEAGSKGKATRDFLGQEILSDAKVAYAAREEALGEPAMRELERRVVLSVIDRRWRDHLYEMDYLKDGIGLRAMAQRDPLVEYQREGYALFQSMMGQIREESVGFLFNLEVEVQSQVGTAQAPVIAAKGLDGGKQQPELEYSAPNIAGEVEVRDQRGRLEQAATAKAQKAQDDAERGDDPEVAAAQATTTAKPAGRGAFGQSPAGQGGSAPVNRAERRAAGKKNG